MKVGVLRNETGHLPLLDATRKRDRDQRRPVSLVDGTQRARAVTTLLRHLRLGFRMFGKHRGTTAIAVVALSLGIGLTTTMFSIIKGHALAGLPFDNPAQLVTLGRSNLSEGMRRIPAHT